VAPSISSGAAALAALNAPTPKNVIGTIAASASFRPQMLADRSYADMLAQREAALRMLSAGETFANVAAKAAIAAAAFTVLWVLLVWLRRWLRSAVLSKDVF
jgi:hypothetical protein